MHSSDSGRPVMKCPLLQVVEEAEERAPVLERLREKKVEKAPVEEEEIVTLGDDSSSARSDEDDYIEVA